MPAKKTYPFPLQYRTGGIPEEVLHVLLQRLTLDWIAAGKHNSVVRQPRHPSFLLAYHKGFQVKNRVKAISPEGKALCLLKTQFAKKPKNPV